MQRSYPVLAPVSEGYPKAEGRSLTCYSPVRHSSTPERAFPYDLHVLSTPPAFVLSQDQTLQQKQNQPPTTPAGSQPKPTRSQQTHTNKPRPTKSPGPSASIRPSKNTLSSSQKTNTHHKPTPQTTREQIHGATAQVYLGGLAPSTPGNRG